MTDEYRGVAEISGSTLGRLLGEGRLPRDISGDHTVTVDDCLYILRTSSASSSNITIPAIASGYSFKPGAALIVYVLGAGIPTLVAGSGVTILNKDGLVATDQDAWIGAFHWGSNSWSAFGSLTV